MVGFFSTYCCVFLLKRLMWMIRYCGSFVITYWRRSPFIISWNVDPSNFVRQAKSGTCTREVSAD